MPRCQARRAGRRNVPMPEVYRAFQAAWRTSRRLVFRRPHHRLCCGSHVELHAVTVQGDHGPGDEPLCFDVHDPLTLLDVSETLQASEEEHAEPLAVRVQLDHVGRPRLWVRARVPAPHPTVSALVMLVGVIT
jgi:hypothetical protein